APAARVSRAPAPPRRGPVSPAFSLDALFGDPGTAGGAQAPPAAAPSPPAAAGNSGAAQAPPGAAGAAPAPAAPDGGSIDAVAGLLAGGRPPGLGVRPPGWLGGAGAGARARPPARRAPGRPPPPR